MNFEEILNSALNTHKEREKIYKKQGFKKQGKILLSIFPEGLELKTEEDFNRFLILNLIIIKFCRYSENFTSGGHEDSIHDLGVYAFLLQELDYD